MSIRADWRLAELEATEDDPFAKVILTTGLTVDLTGGEDAVHEGLRKSLLIEQRLFDRGITCDLKDNEQDCLTCPLYTADRSENRAPLCRLGRDQAMLVNRASEFAASSPYAVLGSARREYAELANDTFLAMR